MPNYKFSKIPQNDMFGISADCNLASRLVRNNKYNDRPIYTGVAIAVRCKWGIGFS
jgi:hypothetical protein